MGRTNIFLGARPLGHLGFWTDRAHVKFIERLPEYHTISCVDL